MGRENFSRAAYLSEVMQKPYARYRNYENININDEFTETKKGSRANFSLSKQMSDEYGVDETYFITLIIIITPNPDNGGGDGGGDGGDGGDGVDPPQEPPIPDDGALVYIARIQYDGNIFKGKIDQDNVQNAIERVTRLYQERYPNRTSNDYDVTVNISLDNTLNSAAVGGPTDTEYDGNGVPTGWIREGQIAVRGTNIDSHMAWPGLDANVIDGGDAGDTLLSHELIHALGFGTTSSSRPDLIQEVPGVSNLWIGSNALAEYKNTFPHLASTAVGVPFQPGDRAHWFDGVGPGNRVGSTLTMNGVEYSGVPMDILTADGGNYISRITAGLLRDLGANVRTDRARADFTPLTEPKTWAFDVTLGPNGGFLFTPNTTIYTNVYTNSNISGENPTFNVELTDRLIFNLQGASIGGDPGLGSTRMAIESSNSSWDSTYTSAGGGAGALDTINLLIDNDDRTVWLYEDIRYFATDQSSNFGRIVCTEANYETGVGVLHDPTKHFYIPRLGRIMWQSASNDYYRMEENYNEQGNYRFPLWSRSSVSGNQPWAWAITCKIKRREVMWTTDGMTVLKFETYNNNDQRARVYINEVQSTGVITATIEMRDWSATFTLPHYNHYYLGFYCERGSDGNGRAFMYDLKSSTLHEPDTVSSGGPNIDFRNIRVLVGKDPSKSGNFHGDISTCVMTTLLSDQATISNAEIISIITEPDNWLTTYKVGQPFRLPATSNAFDRTLPISAGQITEPATGSTASRRIRLNDEILETTSASYTNPLLIPNKGRLERGYTYVFEIDQYSGLGGDWQFSTTSADELGSDAARANVISTSTIGRAGTDITFEVTEDLPDMVFLVHVGGNNKTANRDAPFELFGGAATNGGELNVNGSNFLRAGSTLLYTQGTSANPNYTVGGSLVRGNKYVFRFDKDTVIGNLRFADASPFLDGPGAGNILTSNVSYTDHGIVINIDDTTPDTIFLKPTGAGWTANGGTAPRDGPFTITGSGFVAADSAPVEFSTQALGEELTTARQKSADATKVWVFDGLLVEQAGDITNSVAFNDEDSTLIKI